MVMSTGVVSASLAIMGRFSVNISYNIGLQYAAELLPTVVRAQGVALIHIMGYVASILAPFVVYLVRRTLGYKRIEPCSTVRYHSIYVCENLSSEEYS